MRLSNARQNIDETRQGVNKVKPKEWFKTSSKIYKEPVLPCPCLIVLKAQEFYLSKSIRQNLKLTIRIKILSLEDNPCLIKDIFFKT